MPALITFGLGPASTGGGTGATAAEIVAALQASTGIPAYVVGIVDTSTDPTTGGATAATNLKADSLAPTVTVPTAAQNAAALLADLIETNYDVKAVLKVLLAAGVNQILGFATTSTSTGLALPDVPVTVGGVPLPTPTIGASTVITATITGLNRKSIDTVTLSAT